MPAGCALQEAEAEVEYFPLMRKPAPQRDWAQPDWVSDVAALPKCVMA